MQIVTAPGIWVSHNCFRRYVTRKQAMAYLCEDDEQFNARMLPIAKITGGVAYYDALELIVVKHEQHQNDDELLELI